MKRLIVIILLVASSNAIFAQKAKEVKHKKEHTHAAKATYSCAMHPEVVSYNQGNCAKCSSKLVVDRVGSKQAKTIYTCSMHPEFVSNEAGKCPECNMELEKKTMKKDHTKMKM